jgi:hypothetical protein
MKWIGQHIWDFISRFRNDVYFEDLSSSSDTRVLVVDDTTGKVSYNTDAGGGGGGGVYKRNDSTYPTTVADFTQGGETYDFVLNNSGGGQRLSILNEQQTGIYYEYLQVGTNLTFNISSVSFQNSSGSSINTNSSYLIGDDGNVWQANCQGLSATLNNVGGGSLSSGTLTMENRSSSQTFNSSTINIVTGDLNGSNNLVDFRDDLAESAVDLYYPNDPSWSSGYKTLKFNLILNDGSGNESGSVEWKFYNKIYHGEHANAVLTGDHSTNSGSGSIFGLPHSSYITSAWSINDSGFSTTGTQYYHVAIPTRYGSDVPTFQIDGGPATPMTLAATITDSKNANGYEEDYYQYRTPNAYTDAPTSGTYTITITP